MELGLVQSGFKDDLVARLGAFFEGHDEVLAAYLFGSAAEDGPVVNDVDVLVLVAERDINEVLFLLSKIDVELAEYLGISTDYVDSIPLDLRLVDPEVLYKAVDGGIIVKCNDEEALTDRIEELSHYFLENEPVLQRRKTIRREMLA